MQIKLYPDFENVFTDDVLKGIFYPLCSVILKEAPKKVVHFVSSNGLWMDEQYESKENTLGHTSFKLVNNKYRFSGNIKLYKGFQQVKYIFKKLEEDFNSNGKKYLTKKLKTVDFIELQKQKLELEHSDEFDIDYYLETFYEFSINKLNYQLNKNFGNFRSLIDGWSNDEKSPIIYDESTNELMETLNHIDKPNIRDIETFQVIGKTIGSEFFTDGNDTVLFYNQLDKVVCVNTYS